MPSAGHSFKIRPETAAAVEGKMRA